MKTNSRKLFFTVLCRLARASSFPKLFAFVLRSLKVKVAWICVLSCGNGFLPKSDSTKAEKEPLTELNWQHLNFLGVFWDNLSEKWESRERATNPRWNPAPTMRYFSWNQWVNISTVKSQSLNDLREEADVNRTKRCWRKLWNDCKQSRIVWKCNQIL